MPWRIEREGARCQSGPFRPVNDRDVLFAGAVRRVEQGNDIGYIEMASGIPARLPSTALYAEALELIRTVLADFSGLEARAVEGHRTVIPRRHAAYRRRSPSRPASVLGHRGVRSEVAIGLSPPRKNDATRMGESALATGRYLERRVRSPRFGVERGLDRTTGGRLA